MAGRLLSRHQLRLLDLPLMGAVLALALFGCVAISSSTSPKLQTLDLDPHLFLKRQLAYLGVATLVFGATLLFDYRQLRGLGPVVYLGGVVLLIAVLTPLGHHVSGAQRWIDLGFFQMQPSELMKVALVVALAGLFAERVAGPGLGRVGLAVGATAAPGALVYLQPDLGTVMVLFAITFSVLLVAGARARIMVALLAAALATFALAMALGLLRDYQVARLTAFLDEGGDSQQAGYNLSQSKIAVGSGGTFGKGLFGGSQTNLDYVPEQHTDFIFTVIAEETGFVGSLALIGLFGLLLWRCLRIAAASKDRFGARIAAGVAGMLVFQIFINIGMTIGIVPIVGIPLPFVSYGGSALLTGFAGVGLAMNVHMRRFA